MQKERRRGSPWQAESKTDPLTSSEQDLEEVISAPTVMAERVNAGQLGVRHSSPVSKVAPKTTDAKPTDTADDVSKTAPASDSYQGMKEKLSGLNSEARVKSDEKRAERLAKVAELKREQKKALAQGAKRSSNSAPARHRPQQANTPRRDDAREREAQMARIQAQRKSTFFSRLRQRLQRKQKIEEEERLSLFDKLNRVRLERQRRQEQLELAQTYRAEREALERRNRSQHDQYQGKLSDKTPNKSREHLAKRMKLRADAKLREERTRLEKRYREQQKRINSKYRERSKRGGGQGGSQPQVKQVQRLRVRRFRLRRLWFRRRRFRQQKLRRVRERQGGLRLRRTQQVTQRQKVQLKRRQQTRVRQTRQRQRTRRVRQDRQRQQHARQTQRVRQDRDRRTRQDRDRRSRDDRGRRGGW